VIALQMHEHDSHSPEPSAGGKFRFRLRSLILVMMFACVFTAAFAHCGSPGSAAASVLLSVACLYAGLRKSVWLVFAGGGFLVLTAYHCVLFLLNTR
jgi:hypothetical protein